MRQLTLYVLLSLAVCYAVATAQSVGASPVSLLPGYTHRFDGPGIDTVQGEIWKPNGPSIDYQLGWNVGNAAVWHAHRFPNLPALRLELTGEHPFTVVMDDDDNSMTVSVNRANFTAHHVKSRMDVIEVLTIIRMVERELESGR